MRYPLRLAVLLLSACIVAEGRDSLFGRTATSGSQDAQPADTAAAQPTKDAGGSGATGEGSGAGQKDGAGQKHGGAQRNGGGGQRRDGGERKKDAADEAPDEGGVRIRPVKLDEGLAPKDRADFQVSRIDKPLARETTASFREAWTAFRAQNQLGDDGFTRITRPVVTLKAKCLQDLGEGRWLVDAEWTNPGLGDWCPAGLNSDKAILVLEAGAAKVGETVEVGAVHVGLVEARFDCEVPPAAGRRITLRRHAFLAQAALPDDEATRARFQKAVAEGGKAPEAVVVQLRDCRTCGGIGYLRRAVPGKIQDAHDPCPEGCDRGHQRVPVLLTFRP